MENIFFFFNIGGRIKKSVCVGILRIAGDPGADGDITLRLEANETVVSIDTHTKNLTLIKSLDKEVINPDSVKRFGLPFPSLLLCLYKETTRDITLFLFIFLSPPCFSSKRV